MNINWICFIAIFCNLYLFSFYIEYYYSKNIKWIVKNVEIKTIFLNDRRCLYFKFMTYYLDVFYNIFLFIASFICRVHVNQLNTTFKYVLFYWSNGKDILQKHDGCHWSWKLKILKTVFYLSIRLREYHFFQV